MMAADLAVLTTWQIVSPFVYVRSFEYTRSSVDAFGRSTSSAGFCVSQQGKINANFFLLLALLINLSVVVVANFQMFRARKLNTEYSETRYISIAMLVLLQTFLIGAPVMFVASNNPMANIIVKSFNLFMSSGVPLLFIFVPKVMIMRDWRKKMKAMRASRERRRVLLSQLPSQNLAEIASRDAEALDMTLEPLSSGMELGMAIIDQKEELSELHTRLSEFQEENNKIKERNMSLEMQIEVLSVGLSCSNSTCLSGRNSINSVDISDIPIDSGLTGMTLRRHSSQKFKKDSQSLERSLGIVDEGFEVNE